MAKKLYRATSSGRKEIPEDEAVEIRAEWARNEIKQQANQYKEDRQKKYPPISDQLDQIYHEGIDAWKVTIKAVKDAHPKPE